RNRRKHAHQCDNEDGFEEREATSVTGMTPRAPLALAALVDYCASPPFPVPTVTSGFSLRKFFSPIPLTFMRSSGFLNPPFFWRYSTIRSAMALPIPGRPSSCEALAVLRFTGVPVGADADVCVAAAVLRPPVCAAATAT